MRVSVMVLCYGSYIITLLYICLKVSNDTQPVFKGRGLWQQYY